MRKQLRKAIFMGTKSAKQWLSDQQHVVNNGSYALHYNANLNYLPILIFSDLQAQDFA